MQNVTLTPTQAKTVTPQYLDAGGNPTAAPGTPSYTLMDDFGNVPQDKGIISLTPASDGLSALMTSLGPLGSQRVAVNAGSIGASFTATVTAGPAVSVQFLFS